MTDYMVALAVEFPAGTSGAVGPYRQGDRLGRHPRGPRRRLPMLAEADPAPLRSVLGQYEAPASAT